MSGDCRLLLEGTLCVKGAVYHTDANTRNFSFK